MSVLGSTRWRWPLGCRGVTDEELHLYSLNDEGRITHRRHYVETAKQITAYGLGQWRRPVGPASTGPAPQHEHPLSLRRGL